jgi:hypothetical protein
VSGCGWTGATEVGCGERLRLETAATKVGRGERLWLDRRDQGRLQ